jgi:phosphoglucomutase
MKEEIVQKARIWTAPEFDEKTRAEIQALIETGNEKELTDRFYKELEFGTGGMRGVMGAGLNRMNIYTVGRATQGLAHYLLDTYDDTKKQGVAIAYDSRNNSTLFAQEAACVLAANGVHVYIFTELRPTPLLSFTVRYLKNRAGIVITASHNPKEYNGYKVYGDDGGQIISPQDQQIVEYVGKTAIIHGVKRMDYSEGIKEGLITELGTDIEEVYLKKVEELASHIEEGMKEELNEGTRDIKIVYSPLHGSGITLVPRALEKIEGAVVLCEPEQSKPDGNFPTTPSPNPEEVPALTRGIEYARRENADMVIATDPDCDRMGMALPDKSGHFVPINGNQIGVLLQYMIASSYQKSRNMPENPVFISTVVSTELAGDIAHTFGAEIVNVLTGFKFIAWKMREFEESGSRDFVYGFEESYGYLADTFVRDKDGVIAAVMALLLVKYAIGVHGSVFSFLEFLYRKYGMYMEYGKSFTLKGAEGARRIRRLMKTLREYPPEEIKGSRVTHIKDFLSQKQVFLNEKMERDMSDNPPSDVLQFYTQDRSKISVRPSGTEPKIKFYFGFIMPFDGSIEEMKEKFDEKFSRVSKSLFKQYGLE